MPGSTASVSNSGHWLVVGVNWIGDALMSMPALQAWRRANPSVRLSLLVKSQLAPLWQLHTAPNAVLEYQESWPVMRAAARAIRSEVPSRAVIFPNSFRSALLPFLGRVPERVGRRGRWRRALLTEALAPPESSPSHQALEYYDLMGLPRPPGGSEYPELTIPVSAQQGVEVRLRDLPRPLLGIMPGASRGPAKRWPVAHFAALAKRWCADAGGGILLMGAPGDAAAADVIIKAAGCGINLAGKTSLVDWAASVEACDIVVSNDSGGMHLAAALRRPVVALFGATDPRVTGPLGPRVCVVQDEGVRARSIGRTDVEAEKRLAAISPERVYRELLRLFDT